MLRQCIKALLTHIFCAVVGIAIGLFVQVLLCDIVRWECVICR